MIDIKTAVNITTSQSTVLVGDPCKNLSHHMLIYLRDLINSGTIYIITNMQIYIVSLEE